MIMHRTNRSIYLFATVALLLLLDSKSGRRKQAVRERVCSKKVCKKIRRIVYQALLSLCCHRFEPQLFHSLTFATFCHSKWRLHKSVCRFVPILVTLFFYLFFFLLFGSKRRLVLIWHSISCKHSSSALATLSFSISFFFLVAIDQDIKLPLTHTM